MIRDHYRIDIDLKGNLPEGTGEMHQLILASQSPRRKELLSSAGFVFSVMPANIEEIPNSHLSIVEQVCDLALQKAKAVVPKIKASRKKTLILSADTADILYPPLF